LDYVRREIFDTIEDKDLDFKKIARLIGLTPRSFEYFRNGERNLGFRYMIKLSYVVSPKEPHKKLSEWCLSFDSSELIKNSFEYAAITRNVDLLGKLLELHKNSTGTIKECTQIYGFIYQGMNNRLNYSDIIKKIMELKSIKDSALQILVEINKCIGYFHQRRFLTLPNDIYEIECKINKMSDKRELFLKECFLHRLSEIACHSYLHLNNLNLARHYARILINANMNLKVKSEAYYVLGMSYLNEDVDRCIKYLEKSLSIMKLTGIDFLVEFSEYNLNCAKLYSDIKLPDNADPSLLMFESYKNNKVEKKFALKVIKESGDPDLISLFEGICEEGNSELHNKFHDFFSDANFYFAAIVVKELMNRGENSAFIKSLTKLTIFKKGDVLFEENFINCFNNRDIINGSNCA